jgi:hypothetical protein
LMPTARFRSHLANFQLFDLLAQPIDALAMTTASDNVTAILVSEAALAALDVMIRNRIPCLEFRPHPLRRRALWRSLRRD